MIELEYSPFYKYNREPEQNYLALFLKFLFHNVNHITKHNHFSVLSENVATTT